MSAYSLVVAAASAAFALPGGIVSDKVGRLPVLAVCWLLGVRHHTSAAMLVPEVARGLLQMLQTSLSL